MALTLKELDLLIAGDVEAFDQERARPKPPSPSLVSAAFASAGANDDDMARSWREYKRGMFWSNMVLVAALLMYFAAAVIRLAGGG